MKKKSIDISNNNCTYSCIKPKKKKNNKTLSILFLQLLYFYIALVFEMNTLTKKRPGMSNCYTAMAGHWVSICPAEQGCLGSLKQKYFMKFTGNTYHSMWHPAFLLLLGAKMVWALWLIQPLRKGSGSYVPDTLPDKCHQAPNTCWQEADLKSS